MHCEVPDTNLFLDFLTVVGGKDLRYFDHFTPPWEGTVRGCVKTLGKIKIAPYTPCMKSTHFCLSP